MASNQVEAGEMVEFPMASRDGAEPGNDNVGIVIFGDDR